MGFLKINDADESAIKAMIKNARNNFVPWSLLEQHAHLTPGTPGKPITLADKQAVRNASAPQRPESLRIQLGDYVAAISFEEQPTGMVRHLSVSCSNTGNIPHPTAVQQIADAFGFDRDDAFHTWLEEFVPGHFAANMVQIAEPAINLDKPQ